MERVNLERDAEKVNQRRNVEMKMLFCKVQAKLENKSNALYFPWNCNFARSLRNDVRTKESQACHEESYMGERTI